MQTKIKTDDLIGLALDWAVARCELPANWPMDEIILGEGTDYSTDWAQGGPIIEREKIGLRSDMVNGELQWHAFAGQQAWTMGPTPLVAAMRAFVASRLGDEVEVPDELLDNN